MEGFVDNFGKVGSGKQIGVTGRYECRWCGFPVNPKRRQNKGPENVADGNVVTTSSDVVTSVEAKQGCPCCGRFGWAAVSNPPKTETKFLNRRRIRPLLTRSKKRFERF